MRAGRPRRLLALGSAHGPEPFSHISRGVTPCPAAGGRQSPTQRSSRYPRKPLGTIQDLVPTDRFKRCRAHSRTVRLVLVPDVRPYEALPSAQGSRTSGQITLPYVAPRPLS